MSFSNLLLAWRKARQISTSKLASKSGIDQTTIESIENGELDPVVSVVEALAKGLAIPPAWFYSTPKSIELLLGDPDG